MVIIDELFWATCVLFHIFSVLYLTYYIYDTAFFFHQKLTDVIYATSFVSTR